MSLMGTVVPLKKSANSAYLELKNLLSNKLAKADIISVADYLNVKKYVLTEELELNDKEITSISDSVNSFIEITHNKEKVEEVIESTEEGVELDLTDTEQNVEAVEDGSEKADPAKEEPAEEIELPDEVDDSEEDSDLNIEEK